MRSVMKYIFVLFAVIAATSLTAICQIKRDGLDYNYRLPASGGVEKCPVNPDRLYDRQKVLTELAGILDRSIPEYRKEFSAGFYVRNERAAAFDIYDLTDTSNIDSARNGRRQCINFINNHIYHVYPLDYGFSFSHLVILEDGNLKVFKCVNCKDRGDSMADLISYLERKVMNDKDEIINRVKNYRKYGSYTKTDNYTAIRCQAIDFKSARR